MRTPVSGPALKTALLTAMLRQLASDGTLIFTRTKHRARNLATKLAHAGLPDIGAAGKYPRRAPIRLDGFRAGVFDFLVATDIAARGIDVTSISHVINFDMPDTADAYIHRIGRTGRAQATGTPLPCMPEDEGMIRDIEHMLGSAIKRERLPGFDYRQPARRKALPGRIPPTGQTVPSIHAVLIAQAVHKAEIAVTERSTPGTPGNTSQPRTAGKQPQPRLVQEPNQGGSVEVKTI